jgi:hypothetical protein
MMKCLPLLLPMNKVNISHLPLSLPVSIILHSLYSITLAWFVKANVCLYLDDTFFKVLIKTFTQMIY